MTNDNDIQRLFGHDERALSDISHSVVSVLSHFCGQAQSKV